MCRTAHLLLLVLGFSETALAQPSTSESASLLAHDRHVGAGRKVPDNEKEALEFRPEAQSAGTVRQDQLDGVFDSVEPVPLAVTALVAQSKWRGRHWSLQTAPAERSYSYIGDQLTVTDNGAGQNGPETAVYGRGLTVIKQGFPSATAPIGEIDGHLVLLRQSGPTPVADEKASDADGVQLNVQHAGDPGYLAGLEVKSSRVDSVSSTYPITHEIALQLGVIDPFGKNGEKGLSRYAGVNRLTFGYGAIAAKGSLDRAFYGVNTSAGAFEDFIYLGSPGAPLFRVKGATGDVVLGSDGASVVLSRDSANRLAVQSFGGPIAAVQTVQGVWAVYSPYVTLKGGQFRSVTSSGRYQVSGKRLDLTLHVHWQAEEGGKALGALNLTFPPGVSVASFCVGFGYDAANGAAVLALAPAKARAVSFDQVNDKVVLGRVSNLHVSLSCEIE